VSASIARWPAWLDASGNPATFVNNSSLVICRAAAKDFPFANSVIAEPQAMDGTHPLARKRMSAIRSPSNFKLSSRTSPHTGFSTRARASGVSTSPAFRGF